MTIKIVKPDAAAAPSAGDPPAPGAAGSQPEKRNRPLVAPKAPKSAKWQNRVILKTLDGKIEWEKMEPEARKAFEQLFSDEKFLRQFGISKDKQAFEPERVKALYDALSMAYQTVAAMLLKWPREVLVLLAYTDDEKEMLAQPTADLINRFAPSMVMQNKEVIVFLAVFAAVTQKKFKDAVAAMAKVKQQKKPVDVARAAAAGAGVAGGPTIVPPPPPTIENASLDDEPPAPGVM